jgi:hypothetical protein
VSAVVLPAVCFFAFDRWVLGGLVVFLFFLCERVCVRVACGLFVSAVLLFFFGIDQFWSLQDGLVGITARFLGGIWQTESCPDLTIQGSRFDRILISRLKKLIRQSGDQPQSV